MHGNGTHSTSGRRRFGGLPRTRRRSDVARVSEAHPGYVGCTRPTEVEPDAWRRATRRVGRERPSSGGLLLWCAWRQSLGARGTGKRLCVTANQASATGKGLPLNRKMVALNRKTVGLKRKTVGLNRKTIGLNRKKVGFNRKTVGRQRKSVTRGRFLVEGRQESVIRGPGKAAGRTAPRAPSAAMTFNAPQRAGRTS